MSLLGEIIAAIEAEQIDHYRKIRIYTRILKALGVGTLSEGEHTKAFIATIEKLENQESVCGDYGRN